MSIKILEKQVGHITSALSSKPMEALPSSTETPMSTLDTKSAETCKVISLRSGKEYEKPSQQNNE